MRRSLLRARGPPHRGEELPAHDPAAKWATRQVGTGRTVSEVAGELACDWHTVNEAVTTYGTALFQADRKRLNRTSAIGLDETGFVRRGRYRHTSFVTTVADVENHQIIDILPSRNYREVARFLDDQPCCRRRCLHTGPSDVRRSFRRPGNGSNGFRPAHKSRWPASCGGR
ncbi:MAG: hypothetical protein M0004_03265 [Actinomycetota bacterium]|nr:hypothetical protein [Actinomycetota bacterium]